jgi:alkylhydroperoxidase family enzyme
MDERRYEIATLAAARRLRSSYCSLAHGRVLARLIPASVVQDIALGRPSAELDDVDMAVIHLADRVATDATAVTQADIERLRGLGLTDAEILDVVLAAAARCFFSKVLDAVGCDPDAAFNELEPELRGALTVGRPIAAADPA